MNFPGIWHLGSRYLKQNKVKTTLLIAAFTLVFLLPAVITVVVHEVERHMRSRAEETPLLMGRTGSPLELVFNGVYFTKPDLATFPISDLDRPREDSLGQVIPVYSRFSTNGFRIVGTTLDYFRFRDLKAAEGRFMVRLGECVIGSRVAADLGVGVGDFLISSPEALFDLAGVYPLKMKICGVLESVGTPDDSAVFADLKTTWIIEGLGHGHVEAEKTTEHQRLESKEGEEGAISLNASIVEYNEITSENADDFHFHGEEGENPVSAAIVIPRDAKARAMLKGRFAGLTDLQLISPAEEMDELFATVFSVQRLVTGILIVIGIATLGIGALVFLLSYRLRMEEFSNLKKIGADPVTTRALIVFEAAFVLAASLLISGAILGVVLALTPIVLRSI